MTDNPDPLMTTVKAALIAAPGFSRAINALWRREATSATAEHHAKRGTRACALP